MYKLNQKVENSSSQIETEHHDTCLLVFLYVMKLTKPASNNEKLLH